MVDDFDGYAPTCGFVERPGSVAMQRFLCFSVALFFESGFQGFIRVVSAKEINVTHEKTLFVMVGVDEPAGDPLGTVAADLAGVGVDYVHVFRLSAMCRSAFIRALSNYVTIFRSKLDKLDRNFWIGICFFLGYWIGICFFLG